MPPAPRGGPLFFPWCQNSRRLGLAPGHDSFGGGRREAHQPDKCSGDVAVSLRLGPYDEGFHLLGQTPPMARQGLPRSFLRGVCRTDRSALRNDGSPEIVGMLVLQEDDALQVNGPPVLI